MSNSWIDSQFGVVIADAFGFRSLFEFLSQSGFETIRLFFTNHSFFIRDRTEGGRKIIDVDFEMIKVNYYFQSNKKKQYIDVDIGKIKDDLKAATVKTSIFIKKDQNEDHLIFNLFNNGNINGDPNSIIVSPVERTNTYGKWKIHEPNENDEIASNVYLTAVDFAQICNGFTNKSKTKKTGQQQILQIDAYESGIKLTTIVSGNDISPKTSERGFLDPDEYLFTYYVPQILIQSFNTISKFNKQNGIVHIFFEETKPIKITVPVSNFATIRYYFSDFEEKNED